MVGWQHKPVQMIVIWRVADVLRLDVKLEADSFSSGSSVMPVRERPAVGPEAEMCRSAQIGSKTTDRLSANF
jgi:hypothetical protein